MMCSENKIPIITTEESKHDVMSDIEIIPKFSSTEEKKPDEIEQTDQSSKSTDKDEDKDDKNEDYISRVICTLNMYQKRKYHGMMIIMLGINLISILLRTILKKMLMTKFLKNM